VIAVILRDLRWRLLLLLLAAVLFYAYEPGFHQHDGFSEEAAALGPLGISATLSHFAAIAMMTLLAGFISVDRREGYTRIHLSNPMSPLAYFGLRWVIAFAIAVASATLFLVIGQIVAWGAFLGGWQGMVLPVLSALVYGGLMAFFSTVLPRGDAGTVFLLLLLPIFFPQILDMALGSLTEPARLVAAAILPPQNALAELWEGLLLGSFSWGAAAFAAAYGAIFLVAAAIILRLREWP
jgi:hypothetical protein